MSSTYADKPGKGAIFSTEKKSEKGPDYKGNLVLDRDYKAGEQVKLAGWQKTSRRGPMVSLSIDSWKPDPDWKPDPEKAKERENTYRPGGMTRFDDDVPFSPEHR
jgi:hypothetical protein